MRPVRLLPLPRVAHAKGRGNGPARVLLDTRVARQTHWFLSIQLAFSG
ncbi:MAG: hypothetical protein WCD34_10315 [Candidatus Acidiferrum sp.]